MNTTMYMLIIVGIVALVGIIVMISGASSAPSVDKGNSITGNVAGYDGEVSTGGFSKVLFTLFLLGVAGFMYLRKE